MRPLAVDLFCGLGGWAEGLLAEGWDVIGFDIERHLYGTHRYPAQLVVQDVLTLHGSQFKDAALIVASPPCQAYSYRAMPWKRAKEMPPPDNTLFETCFRIQREANKANECAECDGTGNSYRHDEDGDFLECDDCRGTGRRRPYIPLIVENVRGAQKWVGRARWNFGSFYLWGDVPALMPPARLFKTSGHPNIRDGHLHTRHLTNPWEHYGSDLPTAALVAQKMPLPQLSRTDGQACQGLPEASLNEGIKQHLTSSKSPARKMASAMIAKIPFPLSRHIAATFKVDKRTEEVEAK